MRSLLVALLVGLAVLFVASGLPGLPTEAALATPPVQAPVQRGDGRLSLSPAVLGDINNDGIVDIRDYGIWRQAFGATDCGNPADLNGDCIVDIRDYGIWRQNFGHTAPTATATSTLLTTPTPTGTPTATSTPTATPTATSTSTATATSTSTPTQGSRLYVANLNVGVGDREKCRGLIAKSAEGRGEVSRL